MSQNSTFATMLFALTLLSVPAQSQQIQYMPEVQTSAQRKADPLWMKFDNDAYPVVEQGQPKANANNLNFSTLHGLEIQTVSIAQPSYWAKWEKDTNKLIAPLIFSMKYEGKSWLGGNPIQQGTLNILTFAIINPTQQDPIRFLEFQGFSDSRVTERWTRDAQLNIQIDQSFLQATANPALQSYFNDPANTKKWQDKIVQALGQYCFSYQGLTRSSICETSRP